MLQKLAVKDICIFVLENAIAKPNTMTQTRVRLWTVNEYHRMFETGIITAEERVETCSNSLFFKACYY
ncbi:MAG: hypothetical protein V7L29_01435 [Nostoc sp.]|uniref:hypothetical protein n=1 Tax=Nostoc sp. TaxID=1180 RepID=UPI002FFA7A0B